VDPVLHLGICRWILPRLQDLLAGRAYPLQWSPGILPARQLAPSSAKPSEEGETEQSGCRCWGKRFSLVPCCHRVDFGPTASRGRAFPLHPCSSGLRAAQGHARWMGCIKAVVRQGVPVPDPSEPCSTLEMSAPHCPRTSKTHGQRKAGCL